MDLPDKKYQIIYADPPWQYNDRRNKHTRFCGGAMVHYSVMDYRKIGKIPIEGISNKNCILFMWATWPNLIEALYTIDAWGFTYKTIGFIWVKTNKKDSKPFFGIGHYTKSNSEPCLLAIKGHPKITSNFVSSVEISPRQEHSKKPSAIRQNIVSLMGDLPRIELFARENTLGWDVWGNEV